MVTTKLFIGLGSNLGVREEFLYQSRLRIEQVFSNISIASIIYETTPWGNIDQDSFLNQVIEVETKLSPMAVWSKLETIENEMGRTKQIKYGPRCIDLDILLLGGIYFKSKYLSIPHAYLHQRKFVLIPLAEIANDFIHPLYNKSIQELLAVCSDSGSVTKYLN